MGYPGFDDPIAAIRATIAREQHKLFDRVVAGIGSAAGAAAGTARRNLFQRADDVCELLAAVPHRAANGIANLDRGWSARRLTAGETARVAEAYSGRVDPSAVRIVDGAGLSAIAAVAFLHGNPAITVGNTIYIKHEYYSADLTKTVGDVNMLVHEFMHVIQYKELGFARFGKRYLAEMRANGNDPDRLYDYKHRKLDFEHETLEGQAAIAGDYAGGRASPLAADQRNAAALRPRLRGTGIYGN
ncbi:eCIS core domain-containing protein [Glacieibacterium megasporae]|uniref:eCIS core domain-containing protein n=1 Tax=Glacieibacterium megasporae TaxID=2835787 RepID=UPI001C1E20D2|nr:DUF4157 domain-containing protein [Polymorphobacter megasporae]UAJ09151.1 DUF4157 domain-containing protein [Polymorphobacter megasporae]